MEPKRRGRPRKPEGPKGLLTVRVDAALKRLGYEEAEARRETLGHAIEGFLRRYTHKRRRS